MKVLIDINLLRQAIEALEDIETRHYDSEYDEYFHYCCKAYGPTISKLAHKDDCPHVAALTSLRATLEAAEKAEPVAWLSSTSHAGTGGIWHYKIDDSCVPLYTHPTTPEHKP